MARLRCRPKFLLLVGAVLLSVWSLVDRRYTVREELKHTDLFDAWLLRQQGNISKYELKNLGLEDDSETYRKFLAYKLVHERARNNELEGVDQHALTEYLKYQKWLKEREEQHRRPDEGEGERDEWQDPLEGEDEDVEYEDGENEEEEVALTRLQVRRSQMLTSCVTQKATSQEEDIEVVLRRMDIFFEQRATVCTMGKAGSSSWREHLYRVNDIPRNSTIKDDPRVKEYLSQPRDALYTSIMSTARIITVRHPLTRLVSCFRSKYNYGRPMKPYEPKKEQIYLKTHFALDWPTRFFTFWLPALHSNGLIPSDLHLRLNLSEPIDPSIRYDTSVYQRLYNLLKPQILFSHFLTHVVKSHRGGTWNGHWGKYQDLCRPCDLKYDYVVKLETMEEDLEYVFQKLGISSDPGVRKNNSKKRTDYSKYFRYYKWISKELKRNVYEVFKTDMDMFGYTLPKGFL